MWAYPVDCTDRELREDGVVQPEIQPDADVNIWALDWSKEYESCPQWKNLWISTKDDRLWPKGITLQDGKLLSGGM